jgi:hypothetical protein
MTQEQWDRVVRIQALIDEERERLRDKDPHPTGKYSNTNEIGPQTPNAI